MTQFPHLERLIQTMATLRGPEGCQWDREQDHDSLVRYLIEETYELVDAIETGDRAGMREELGDVLYQLLFHADIAQADESDPFGIDDVARVVDEKMRRRHPHVFGDVDVSGVDEIRENWQKLKAQEKAERNSVLDGVSQSVQGIARAVEVLDKAHRVGVSVQPGDTESFATEREWGRYLLERVAAARQQGFDPDRAVREAIRELEDQIREVESTAPGQPAPRADQ